MVLHDENCTVVCKRIKLAYCHTMHKNKFKIQNGVKTKP